MGDSGRMTFAIGTLVDFRFPGSHNVYRCRVSEQHPARKVGEDERYRITGAEVDCFALRAWLDQVPESGISPL